MTTIFIVGCGYVGMRVAQSELVCGHQVIALTHSPIRNSELLAANIIPIIGDLDNPSSLSHLPTKDALLYYFAPPPATGVTDPRLVAFLHALSANNLPRKIILISTTGVYGDCQGAWIDENRPINPQTDRARRRAHAEMTLLAWSKNWQVPSVILRVPGIYGVDRLPIQRLQQQLPVLDETVSPFSNRIHVDDLAIVCLAAAIKGQANNIYNVSDGHPTTMTDYFNHVADALGLARPPVIERHMAQQQLSAEMLSYLAESKRLDNRKMREELGVVLQYPDLATGLA